MGRGHRLAAGWPGKSRAKRKNTSHDKARHYISIKIKAQVQNWKNNPAGCVSMRHVSDIVSGRIHGGFPYAPCKRYCVRTDTWGLPFPKPDGAQTRIPGVSRGGPGCRRTDRGNDGTCRSRGSGTGATDYPFWGGCVRSPRGARIRDLPFDGRVRGPEETSGPEVEPDAFSSGGPGRSDSDC